jgi:hypothetical protein
MLKQNRQEVQDRYRAFWRNEPVDRPPVGEIARLADGRRGF